MSPVIIRLPITSVTAFEDRADVLRTGTLTLAEGASVLVLRGVSSAVSDAHVVAQFEGAPTTVDDVRVERRMDSAPPADPDRRQLLASTLAAHEQRIRDATAVLARLQERHAVLTGMLEQTAAQVSRALWPRGADAPRWLPSVDGFRKQLEASTQGVLAAHRDVKQAEQEVARAREGLAGIPSAAPRLVADIHIRVHSQGGDVKARVSTLVPCAVWRPAHEVDLTSENRLRWELMATVWQHTGEDWDNVELNLSTARPGAGAELPDLSEDRLRARLKSAEERRTISIEHRQEAIPRNDLQGAAPGVYDGGTPRLFRAPAPVSVRSDGRPHRVPLGSFEAPTRVERVAMPEVSPHVFLRASLKNMGNAPVLAGPVMLKRAGQHVGIGDVAYVGPGEAFDLSLGSQDAFVVRYERRRVEEEKTLGRNVTHYVQDAVLSVTGAGPETVRVFLRLPVSEVAQLKVVPSKEHCSEGLPEVDPQGVVTLGIQVRPGEERKVSLGFSLDAGSDVRVPAPW